MSDAYVVDGARTPHGRYGRYGAALAAPLVGVGQGAALALAAA